MLQSLSNVPLLRRWIPSVNRRVRLATGNRFFLARAHGKRFLLDIQNLIDRRIAAWGTFEPEQVERFLGEAKRRRPRIFLDVGACWGYYSLLMHGLPGLEEIHAFEPDPVNRSQLFANILINEAHAGIRVHDYGISDRSGRIAFSAAGERNRGSSHVAGPAGAEDGTAIEVRALDEVMQPSGERIFIKIDVEGHELQAVAGMRHLLQANDCFLQIESFETNLPRLVSAMRDLGYRKEASVESDHYFTREMPPA